MPFYDTQDLPRGHPHLLPPIGDTEARSWPLWPAPEVTWLVGGSQAHPGRQTASATAAVLLS